MSNQERADFDILMKALTWLERADDCRDPELCADMARYYLNVYDIEYWPALYNAVLSGLADISA